MQRYFLFDPDSCFGCYGCIAACINANRLSGQQHWRKVLKLPPHSGRSDTLFLSLACNHCDHPACVKACPNNAMIKRKEDGVVLHLSDRCMGCRYCQMACPYDAIIWMEEKKIVGKCQLCVERLDQNSVPACVETCFGKALSLQNRDNSVEESGEDRETTGFVHHSAVKPNIRFKKFNRKKGNNKEYEK